MGAVGRAFMVARGWGDPGSLLTRSYPCLEKGFFHDRMAFSRMSIHADVPTYRPPLWRSYARKRVCEGGPDISRAAFATSHEYVCLGIYPRSQRSWSVV